ncbi:hypothetical protein AVEN_169837-1, partial [Araneus ventricosus]
TTSSPAITFRLAHGNGLWLTEISGTLLLLSPERSQNLTTPQKKPTAVAVKGKCLDRQKPPRSV